MESKFKPGNKVRVINYGHIIWTRKDAWPDLAQWKADYLTIEAEFWYRKPLNNPIKPKEKPDHVVKEDEEIYYHDIKHSLIGKEGIVKGSYADIYGLISTPTERDYHRYHVDGITGKCAWYNEDQLELI